MDETRSPLTHLWLLSHRYSLGDALGAGARSTVYRGYDLRLGRTVAVKVLRPELAVDAACRDRFRRRARDAAVLRHAAIVAVYDTGEAETDHGRLPYVVMEYVDGRTLRDILDTHGAMNVKSALEIVADVCAVLDFAHRHGITHQEVEPGNVMLTRTGAVKVLGFGEHHAPMSTVDVGTDVRDVGKVLCELIAGAPPFPDAPPTIDPALDAVVAKAMAYRYRSAAGLRADLVRALPGNTPPPARRSPPAVASRAANRTPPDGPRRPEPNQRRHRNPVVVLSLACLVALVALLLPGKLLGGGDAVAIPRIKGRHDLAAEHALHDAGFDNVTRHLVPCWPQAYGEKPPCPEELSGKAIRTEPAEGIRAVPSTEITLYVGQGPQRFPMPQVVTRKRSAAARLLAAKDLLLHRDIELVDNTDPAKTGTIATQVPRPGAVVAQGDVVRLSVYRRPQLIAVDDYTGKPYEVAHAGLSAAGFMVVGRVIDAGQPRGVVVRQDPGRGKAVKGSEVALEVSNGAHEPR